MVAKENSEKNNNHCGFAGGGNKIRYGKAKKGTMLSLQTIGTDDKCCDLHERGKEETE